MAADNTETPQEVGLLTYATLWSVTRLTQSTRAYALGDKTAVDTHGYDSSGALVFKTEGAGGVPLGTSHSRTPPPSWARCSSHAFPKAGRS